MAFEFENYHCHSDLSQFLVLPDSPASYEDYANVYRERGMHCLFAVEHGNRGDVFRCQTIAEKFKEKYDYDLKVIAGTEAYFVPDRKEKDGTNAHLILIAKDMEGYYELNEILSESYETGMYKRNRIDWELLRRLNPEHFICTTACVAGPIGKYDEDTGEQIAYVLHSMFKENFYLEVQAHNVDYQIEHNRKIMRLHERYGWPLIFATDSHYINREDVEMRSEILKANNIFYEDEGAFNLFLPTAQEAHDLLIQQGVLTEEQIAEAMRNTLKFRVCEGVHFDHAKKIPNPYKELTQEQRDQMYWNLVHNKYEELYGDTPAEQKKVELEDIEVNELQPVIDTHTTDYFLSLKRIIDKGIEKGGIITHTGRGSGVSFASNHLLGFTSVNRLRCEVTLFPERFISRDRLEAGSMPDFDLNLVAQKPFVEAGQELFGEYSFLPMIKYDTQKSLAAFKMLARAREIEPSVADAISKQLKKYDTALKYAEEDEKDMIDISEYVSPEYLPLVEESKKYRSIISGGAPHPCAHIMVEGDCRRLFGTMLRKAKSGSKEPVRVVNITGDMADAFGYPKMDLLIVSCVNLAESAFKDAGVPMPTVQELVGLTKNDAATWAIYSKGLTMGVNQVEQPKSTAKAMRYKPGNVAEMCALVAALRPGFKSMINAFLSRENYSYGIPVLDKILRTKEMPNASWLLYQEQIMSIGAYAGIPPTDGYKLIKAISKKKQAVIDSKKEGFITGLENKGVSNEAAEKVWTIINDAASYMFNASHSYCVACDSLYAAYVKAHYPLNFYRVYMEMYVGKDKDKVAAARAEALKGFGIRVVPPKFRQDNRRFQIDKENRTISDVLSSAKGMGKFAAEDLYKYKDSDYKYFCDLIYDIWQNTSLTSAMIEILIKANYFEEYGGNLKLLTIWQEVKEGKNKLNPKLKSLEARKTKLRELEDGLEDGKLSVYEQVRFEIDTYDYPLTTYKGLKQTYVVTALDDKYGYKLNLFNLGAGTSGAARINKTVYARTPIKVGDCIKVTRNEQRPLCTYENGKRIPVPGMIEVWLTRYTVIKD